MSTIHVAQMAYNISTQDAQYEAPPYVAATTVDTSEVRHKQ